LPPARPRSAAPPPAASAPHVQPRATPHTYSHSRGWKRPETYGGQREPEEAEFGGVRGGHEGSVRRDGRAQEIRVLLRGLLRYDGMREGGGGGTRRRSGALSLMSTRKRSGSPRGARVPFVQELGAVRAVPTLRQSAPCACRVMQREKESV
jgi:hypothetical protein